MTRICHVLDSSVGWEHRLALSQLFDRLPPNGFSNELTAIDARAVAYLRGLDRPIELLQGGKVFAVLAAQSVARRIRRGRFELVHAWGLRAALAAGAARSAPGIAETPLVIELFDPGVAPRQIKMLRILARASRVAIVASCQRLIRTLVEGGVRPDVCVLIRPGVDFGLINRSRRGSLRAELGLSSDHNVVIVPDPATRQGGRWEEFWCAKLVSHLDPNLRIVIPGDSPDLSRIERQARITPGEPVLIAPGQRYPFEQLVAIADTLVVGARGDVPTTSLAWAMASETLVIATAVYSVAELIANKLNGLLCTPTRGGRLAIPLAKLLMDAASPQNLKEVARAQAYEVFSVRRYVEQHVRLYENILHDRPLSENIEDPALVV